METTKEENIVPKPEEKPEEAPVKKGFNIKILLFGLPLFVVQLAAVYFITANILLPKIQTHSTSVQSDSVNTDQAQTKKDSVKNIELGKFVYVVDDLIINPAGTDGKRLLLSSIGFDLADEKFQQELKSKEVLVKDAIISVMGSKNMTQLGNSLYRDTLRIQITDRIKKLIPNVEIGNVYFSKYILQ